MPMSCQPGAHSEDVFNTWSGVNMRHWTRALAKDSVLSRIANCHVRQDGLCDSCHERGEFRSFREYLNRFGRNRRTESV